MHKMESSERIERRLKKALATRGADMSRFLDTIFHINDEELFDRYMRRLERKGLMKDFIIDTFEKDQEDDESINTYLLDRFKETYQERYDDFSDEESEVEDEEEVESEQEEEN